MLHRFYHRNKKNKKQTRCERSMKLSSSSSIMHPIFWLIIVSICCFKYGECLKCYSCDGSEDCANPREELCPKNNECFTVAENYDVKLNGLRKGCSPTCDRVNIQGKLCRLCKFELCNGKTGLGKAFEKPAILPLPRPFDPKKDANRHETKTYIFIIQLLLVLIFLHYNPHN